MNPRDHRLHEGTHSTRILGVFALLVIGLAAGGSPALGCRGQIAPLFPYNPYQDITHGYVNGEYLSSITLTHETPPDQGLMIYFTYPESLGICGNQTITSVRLFPRSGTGPVFPVNSMSLGAYFHIDNLTAPGFYDLAFECEDGSQDTVCANIEYRGYRGYEPSGVLHNSLTGNIIRGAIAYLERLYGGGWQIVGSRRCGDGTYSFDVIPGTYRIHFYYELNGQQYRGPFEVPPPLGATGDDGAPTTRVGGDSWADAYVIDALPFADSGNTCGFAHDVDLPCYTNFGADVMYRYTPTVDDTIGIAVAGASNYYSVLGVYDSSHNNLRCSYGLCYLMNDIELHGGETYYFVVSGQYNYCGDYGIEVASTTPIPYEDVDLVPVTADTTRPEVVIDEDVPGELHGRFLDPGVGISVLEPLPGTVVNCDPGLGYTYSHSPEVSFDLWSVDPNSPSSVTLVAIDQLGNRTERSFDIQTTPAGVPAAAGPSATDLSVFPNPGPGTAELVFRAPTAAPQSVEIFDAAGRLVRAFAVGARPGWNRVTLDGRDGTGRLLSPGVYHVMLRQQGTELRVRKVVFIR